MQKRSPVAPQLAILLSTVLWGTLWIPVRRLHELGSEGEAWTTIGFVIPLAFLLPAAIRRRHRILLALRDLGNAGFWLALGIALYVEGVTRGEVARVILLFYLTPVWSTLLARIVLGDAITRRRFVTMVLGVAGMLVIFGAEGGYPVPRSSADWMGLVAGFAWGVALVFSRREKPQPLFDRLFVHFVFLGPVFFCVTLLPGGGSPPNFELTSSAELLGWAVALALGWMLPVLWLTSVGASQVPPGRFAILLMFEVVVGLTTAALLTEERLAPREYIGALLILSAIGTEFVIKPSTTPNPSPDPTATTSFRGRER
ncbi:MAG: DMT family transporter [Deltaproteobacteria bacterium]|nr:DMT family transporter [Deltaproteobacteria bacterium]